MQGVAPDLARRTDVHRRAAMACTPIVKLLQLCRPADMLPLPAARARQVKHALSLDHADGPDAGDEDGGGSGRGPRTNMNWLTKSDINGLPTASGIVLEAIRSANRDVPEVTQVGRGRGEARRLGAGETVPLCFRLQPCGCWAQHRSARLTKPPIIPGPLK